MTTQSYRVHVSSGASSQRIGQEEMDMLYRMANHRGGRSQASVMREAISLLYDKEVKSMDEKTKKLKYTKNK